MKIVKFSKSHLPGTSNIKNIDTQYFIIVKSDNKKKCFELARKKGIIIGQNFLSKPEHDISTNSDALALTEGKNEGIWYSIGNNTEIIKYKIY